MVGGLRTSGAWTFVSMGNFQSVEVGEELTVSSSQFKGCAVFIENEAMQVLIGMGNEYRQTAAW